MAEKYNNWCADYTLVDYKDEQGNQYCVFHAPQGKKGYELKQFNGLVFKRIYEHRKSDCDFSGTVFEGNIEFTGVSPITGGINFQDAVFHGEARFPKTVFTGEAVFSNAHFKRTADFREATFEKSVNFTSTHFYNAVDFMHANFRDSAIFDQIIVDGNILLMNTFFTGPNLFTRASFKGKAFLEHAKFEHYTNFYGSHFYNDAHFGWAKFNGLTWFNEITFDKVAAFDNSKISGELECIQSVFKGRVSFLRAELKDRNYFGDCEFRESINFDHTWFGGRTIFKGKTLYGACSFQNLNITTKMRLEGVDCKQISFLDTDVRQIDFVNCDWLKTGRRNILFDEQNLISNKKEQASAVFKKVESLYRKLKQKYKEEHDEAETSNWHYGEKSMYRLSNKWRRYLPSVTTLYWLSSGYGERPARASIVLFATLIGFSIAILACGLTVPEGVENVHGITNSDLSKVFSLRSLGASFMNLLKYVTFQRDSYFGLTGWLGETVKLLAQIIVPVQTALVALAIRNRFRR